MYGTWDTLSLFGGYHVTTHPEDPLCRQSGFSTPAKKFLILGASYLELRYRQIGKSFDQESQSAEINGEISKGHTSHLEWAYCA